MKIRLVVFIVALVLLACIGSSAQRDNVREAKPGEVPFAYNVDDYGKVQIESVEKVVFDKNSTPEESPAHSCFHLEDKRPLPALDQGPRYFYPAESMVCVIPLADRSVKDFARSYPYLHQAAAKLRKLLAKRPTYFKANRDLNDMPYNNASSIVQSKIKYVDFKNGTGVLFLTQYSQDTLPTPINNEELACDFQGLSNDGKYYVAARLAITNPSLPKGIDFAKPPGNDRTRAYLNKEEKMLNAFADDSFHPTLTSLKSLIASIKTE